MSQTIETLAGLERRIQLTVPAADLENEVKQRLVKLARTLRMPGFRPGKVPMKMVVASYGAQVQAEVLNDKVGAAFDAAVTANQLRVAGTPRLEAKSQGEDAGNLAFDATFEVFPEIKVTDLSAVEVEQAVCHVGDAEVDKTIEIMRRQRATFAQVERAAAAGDRATVDFVGSIDGTPFQGGSGTDLPITLGQGRMLPGFEEALIGMKAGEKKTFPLSFPADYRATELAGKTTSFDVTVKKVEQANLPEVDADFARALGVKTGDLEKMRAEIKANLEREVAARLKARTKDSVMQGLLSIAQFELPKALVQREQERLAEAARADLTARGMNANDVPMSSEIFAPQAERRVRLGLIVGELVRLHGLQARQDQVRKNIDQIAQSYEKPAEVIQWYLGNRERLNELENAVTEDNVTNWALRHAKTTDKPVAFDELMGHRG
ncbi:MAG TPA: trigger factor [Burkholderiaceae bacterium]|nr:trigger factor [Burkholderiaceae bacterium]